MMAAASTYRRNRSGDTSDEEDNVSKKLVALRQHSCGDDPTTSSESIQSESGQSSINSQTTQPVSAGE